MQSNGPSPFAPVIPEKTVHNQKPNSTEAHFCLPNTLPEESAKPDQVNSAVQAINARLGELQQSDRKTVEQLSYFTQMWQIEYKVFPKNEGRSTLRKHDEAALHLKLQQSENYQLELQKLLIRLRHGMSTGDLLHIDPVASAPHKPAIQRQDGLPPAKRHQSGPPGQNSPAAFSPLLGKSYRHRSARSPAPSDSLSNRAPDSNFLYHNNIPKRTPTPPPLPLTAPSTFVPITFNKTTPASSTPTKCRPVNGTADRSSTPQMKTGSIVVSQTSPTSLVNSQMPPPTIQDWIKCTRPYLMEVPGPEGWATPDGYVQYGLLYSSDDSDVEDPAPPSSASKRQELSRRDDTKEVHEAPSGYIPSISASATPKFSAVPEIYQTTITPAIPDIKEEAAEPFTLLSDDAPDNLETIIENVYWETLARFEPPEITSRPDSGETEQTENAVATADTPVVAASARPSGSNQSHARHPSSGDQRRQQRSSEPPAICVLPVLGVRKTRNHPEKHESHGHELLDAGNCGSDLEQSQSALGDRETITRPARKSSQDHDTMPKPTNEDTDTDMKCLPRKSTLGSDNGQQELEIHSMGATTPTSSYTPEPGSSDASSISSYVPSRSSWQSENSIHYANHRDDSESSPPTESGNGSSISRNKPSSPIATIEKRTLVLASVSNPAKPAIGYTCSRSGWTQTDFESYELQSSRDQYRLRENKYSEQFEILQSEREGLPEVFQSEDVYSWPVYQVLQEKIDPKTNSVMLRVDWAMHPRTGDIYRPSWVAESYCGESVVKNWKQSRSKLTYGLPATSRRHVYL